MTAPLLRGCCRDRWQVERVKSPKHIINNKHSISVIVIIIIPPTSTIWSRGKTRAQGKVWHCLFVGALPEAKSSSRPFLPPSCPLPAGLKGEGRARQGKGGGCRDRLLISSLGFLHFTHSPFWAPKCDLLTVRILLSWSSSSNV